jgi:hypothetical protein
MKTLREIFAEAQDQIETYRHPSTWEAKEKINQIIAAAGLGDISHDSLAWISIASGTVSIRTEYSVRGCTNSDEYEFPVSIIDAVDPIRAAKEWGLRRKLIKAQSELDEARRVLAHREEQFAKADAALAEFFTQ